MSRQAFMQGDRSADDLCHLGDGQEEGHFVRREEERYHSYAWFLHDLKVGQTLKCAVFEN